jgi:hypothetical protein
VFFFLRALRRVHFSISFCHYENDPALLSSKPRIPSPDRQRKKNLRWIGRRCSACLVLHWAQLWLPPDVTRDAHGSAHRPQLAFELLISGHRIFVDHTASSFLVQMQIHKPADSRDTYGFDLHTFVLCFL